MTKQKQKGPFTPPLQLKTLVIAVISLISTNFNAQTTFTATSVKADTIKSSVMINADAITATDTLRAKEDVIAEHDVKVSGNLYLLGQINLPQTMSLKVATSTSGNGSIITLGKDPALLPTGGPPAGDDPAACITNVTGFFTPGANMGLFTSRFNGANKSTLSMQVEDNGGIGNGYIDLGGALNGSTNGVLNINNKCSFPTRINTAGGSVFMGDQVFMNKFVTIGGANGQSTGFGTPLFITRCTGGTANEVYASNNNVKAYSVNNSTGNYAFNVFGDGRTQINGTSVTSKYFTVADNTSGTPVERFVVYGDGKTYIGIQKPISTGPHANAKLAVDGKILAKEIYVNIHTTVWADYVFDKNYKLMPLKEVEEFIKKNKHLPNVPSAKDLTSTDDYNLSIADMQKIQMEKIEEIFLHLIELNKQVKELQKENKELKLKMENK